jgi:GntR family transcriptional regulator, transcriptional repressor for pyruvate dehydrogenase complex
MTERTSQTPFRTLPQLRTFEQIILQIEEAILDGKIKPGDRLPAERELAETFGVSRASVREALRVLEMFGVVVARRGTGPDAGSIVADGAQNGIGNALRLHAGLLRIPTRDIVDVRASLESHAARRAAASFKRGDTARLRAIVASMREADAIDAYNELDTEYHVELARISRNALLPVLMEALRGAMRRDMLMGFASLDDWRAERDRLVAEHEQIIGCIEGRDEDGAAEALRNHVVRFYRKVIGDEPGQLVGEVSG